MSIAHQPHLTLEQTSSIPTVASTTDSTPGDFILHEIAKLPDAQKRSIELYYLQRKSLTQTAARMNVSRATAARLIASGLKTLRPWLADTHVAD